MLKRQGPTLQHLPFRWVLGDGHLSQAGVCTQIWVFSIEFYLGVAPADFLDIPTP